MRIGVLFLVAGACCVGMALSSSGPWAWVLGWSAAAFTVVGLGYTALGPAVLGKREDGSVAWWARAGLLPFRVLAWLAWYLQPRVFPEAPFDRVAPGLYVGRRCAAHEMPRDAKLVVDLTAEFAEPEHLRTAADYRCLPVLDGSVPNLERFDALVQELADFQGPIFVHCAAGHGRSGMVAAAVLVRRGEAADVHEAIDRMRKARPRIRLGRRQRRLVERLQPVTPAWAAA